MPSKSGLILVLLLSLAQADSVQEKQGPSLSFGPPSVQATFVTDPLNPRRRVVNGDPNDQSTVHAFAKWYMQHILRYQEDSWRVVESKTRHDANSGVWRVETQQVLRNGTIEVVDGRVSLNILNGEVISYGDSFYRGSPPESIAAGNCRLPNFDMWPMPDGYSNYNLQAYCSLTMQLVQQVWLQENPKWAQVLRRRPQTGGHKAAERESQLYEKCSANIARALDTCIQEHSPPTSPLAWLRSRWAYFRREVLQDHWSFPDNIPKECVPLSLLTPLDDRPPAPHKVLEKYDEDTCTWTFSTNHSTISARLDSLRKSRCEVRPRLTSACAARDQEYMNSEYVPNFAIEQLIYEDKSEMMDEEGIINPAIAVMMLAANVPQPQEFWNSMEDVEAVLRRIRSYRRRESGAYNFELRNVPGVDGSVNATLVYVQVPPQPSPGPVFDLGDEENQDEEAQPKSQLTIAWKLPIVLTDGRKFEGYIEARGNGRGALVRLLDLSERKKGAQALPFFPARKDSDGAESCFGWGESRAILGGVDEIFGANGSANLNGKTTSSPKPVTYRSLDGPRYWGTERMGHVWAEILGSVNREILAHEDADPDDEHAEHASSTVSNDQVLRHFIPLSLALLPCNPTFFMARDALIQAEQITFGQRYACDLWRGFAQRGLGVDASASFDVLWTPWGGGKRKDGFDVPEECVGSGKEGKSVGGKRVERRDEL
ncbi:Fungalysin/Thermolysin Extracellular metalloproteinase 5 [Tulasnella sp. 427]|nr:Fungalysin/Thermolysin Extracellular metalloproteinase 5 [Tulasnella sp. 427]